MNTPSSTATTEEMVTLKPCPFCEGEAETISLFKTAPRGRTFVKCQLCGASGTAGAYATAVAAWNTRPDSAGVPDGLVEREIVAAMNAAINFSRYPDDKRALCPTFIEDRARQCLAALSARLSPPKVDAAIPEGMVPWHGGDSAPDDWDGGPVWLRSGRLYDYVASVTGYDNFQPWLHDGHPSNIIAYTPLASTTRGAEDTQAEVVRTPLETFGALIFDTLWESFTDGGWEIEVNDLITETATKAGLVDSVDYDPEQHDDPHGACEAGDDYYVISNAGREALKIARAALQGEGSTS